MPNSRAYIEGYDAHGESMALSENPYGQLTKQHDDWDQGWFQADMEEKGIDADEYFGDEWEDDNDNE